MPPSNTKPRVFLIGNAEKPEVPDPFRRLSGLLSSRGLLAGSDLQFRPENINPARPDYVVALGGDGTILAVGQAMQQRQVPIVGVNLGKLGYLADFSVDELERDFGRILGDPDLVSRRMMLDVRLDAAAGDQPYDGIALNDCVIRVAQPFRTVGLAVDLDGHPVTTIVSDGLIVSTPTGSTAHNMSCGGPIVQPDVDAIILTPLCPHSLTHRPVVVGPQAKLGITVRATSMGAALVLDGQFIRPLPGGSRLVITCSKQHFQLVRNPARKGWDTLVQKLKWGQGLT
jgi:NAD+ kinase